MTDVRRALAIVVGCLLMAGLVVQLAVRPRLREATRLDGRIEQARDDVRALDARVRTLRQARADAPANDRAVRALTRALPAEPQPAALLRDLGTQARRDGLDLRDAAVQAAAAAPGPAPGVQTTGLGSVLPLQAAFSGRYADLGRLAGDLAGWVRDADGRLRVSGRLVTLEGFELAADPAGTGVEADFALLAWLAPAGGTR